MKSITICVLGFLVLLSHSVSYADKLSCAEMGNIASGIMIQRQNGRTLSDIMSVLPEPADSLLVTMITIAYSVPQYDTLFLKQDAVKAYGEFWEVGCIKDANERRKK